jgi:hypothetical protein
MKKTNGLKGPDYVFGPELIEIVAHRPKLLTLVFDQSLARGTERTDMSAKLSAFASQGIYGFPYMSHACFVLLGTNMELVRRAFNTLQNASGLPKHRFDGVYR